MTAMMIVDDSLTMRRILTRMLGELDMLPSKIVEARNGAEAVQSLAAHPDVNLIVTDFRMPDMDGFELIRNVRQNHGKEDLPIIVVTADHSEVNRERAMQIAANGWLKKPFSAGDLSAVLSPFLVKGAATSEGFAGPGEDPSLSEALEKAADVVFQSMLSTVAVLIQSHGASATSGERESDSVEEGIEVEAVVEFYGVTPGAVVLRCTAEGALDIARGLLMVSKSEPVPLEEVEDALGECANMLSGLVKSYVPGLVGLKLGIPVIGAYAVGDHARRRGCLVYRLARGCAAIEVWIDEPEPGSGAEM